VSARTLVAIDGCCALPVAAPVLPLTRGRWRVGRQPYDEDGPPQVPEQPVPVLSDDQLGALIDACAGKDFTARATPRSSAPCWTRADHCQRSPDSSSNTSTSTWTCSTSSVKAVEAAPCPSDGALHLRWTALPA
jgi:hypothetical protein